MPLRKRDRISVAMCTFNGGRYIEQQLTTIARQSRQPDEIVISDDGSTDGTLDLVRAWASQRTDTRVVTSRERLGVTRNFERAIRACTGSLIALADQDDVWNDARLEVQENTFIEHPSLLLVHGDAELIDEHGRLIGRSLVKSLRVSDEDRARINSGGAYDLYLRRNLATGATTMFRRSLLDEALPFPHSWVHDEWLAILAAALGEIRLDDNALVLYRQHGSNHIGVAEAGLGYRLRRIFEHRGERNTRLAARAVALAARLEALSDRASQGVRAKATAKAAFEARRASFPAGRLRRASEVFREARRGDYSRYASQGRLDIVRDLLQPS